MLGGGVAGVQSSADCAPAPAARSCGAVGWCVGPVGAVVAAFVSGIPAAAVSAATNKLAISRAKRA
jgi:hypothetical protein